MGWRHCCVFGLQHFIEVLQLIFNYGKCHIPLLAWRNVRFPHPLPNDLLTEEILDILLSEEGSERGFDPKKPSSNSGWDFSINHRSPGQQLPWNQHWLHLSVLFCKSWVVKHQKNSQKIKIESSIFIIASKSRGWALWVWNCYFSYEITIITFFCQRWRCENAITTVIPQYQRVKKPLLKQILEFTFLLPAETITGNIY